jgi:hypothetical protein
MKITPFQNRWFAEVAWIIVSILLSFIVLIPIFAYQVEYPFILHNVLFIIGFVTFTRWLFLWKFTPYAWSKWLKLSLVFLMIPVIFTGISMFFEFRVYLDDIGLQEILSRLRDIDQRNLALYIRSEMIFFGTAYIITSILIPFKMIWSIWKQYNRNEV